MFNFLKKGLFPELIYAKQSEIDGEYRFQKGVMFARIFKIENHEWVSNI